jgi:hypothetical protein
MPQCGLKAYIIVFIALLLWALLLKKLSVPESQKKVALLWWQGVGVASPGDIFNDSPSINIFKSEISRDCSLGVVESELRLVLERFLSKNTGRHSPAGAEKKPSQRSA